MAGLFFGGVFRADVQNPANPTNDRLIFSKGHAAPLLYSIYAVAGAVSENELLNLRRFGSRLEGHPTMRFPYTEAPTGSLGQGLAIGAGLALSAKYLEKLPFRTFVLLGDSEMAEGSVWETIQLAAHYRLNNLIGIIDVNGLGQRGATMYGHDAQAIADRVAAFGWDVTVIDGHDLAAIVEATKKSVMSDRPFMIIASTRKGRGVAVFEGQEGWHGKALNAEQMREALTDLGAPNHSLRALPTHPEPGRPPADLSYPPADPFKYEIGDKVSTRKAYGNALARLAKSEGRLVVLDAEVSNSTFSDRVKAVRPDRFFEMFIAEQNMVGMGLGLARRGHRVVISTFAAFLTRAHDQLRMAQYAEMPLVVIGSHAGASIGQDGASQMGLEDLAFFRTLLGSTVLYPSDAVACERALEEALHRPGITYIRTTRADTPVIYESSERFPAGGLKVLRQNPEDVGLIVAAGITVHEALVAYEELKRENILVRVIDLYSVKPLDAENLRKHARRGKFVISVEDHSEAGGLGEAVAASLTAQSCRTPIVRLAVRQVPMSGTPQELLDYEEISHKSIVEKVKELTAAGK
jgi:transketolase